MQVDMDGMLLLLLACAVARLVKLPPSGAPTAAHRGRKEGQEGGGVALRSCCKAVVLLRAASAMGPSKGG